eukprot:CAMPEP_0172450592 /NCGR_PEP_ID=MMETSP1065-20121228/8874_1 /TAXON_ID=265537 /ORGANISM="Amphiprora paludosa, Strain CCMP125" /LENGTH=179 /DNA_ID=CAMNT_0013202385 /DNA_START=156 /DNA_END=695 /DNA_ORIENTATION=+
MDDVHGPWPKPKKLSKGKVVYWTKDTTEGTTEYTRIFTVPCAYGVLAFNIGPAPQYAPYAYEIYQDAYAFSDNGGLCPLYPSWKASQTSDFVLWNPQTDANEHEVKLGDTEQLISTRVVQPPHSKANVAHGGDFVIMRKGNFYSPQYFRQLQEHVHSFPPDLLPGELERRLQEFGKIQD